MTEERTYMLFSHNSKNSSLSSKTLYDEIWQVLRAGEEAGALAAELPLREGDTNKRLPPVEQLKVSPNPTIQAH